MKPTKSKILTSGAKNVSSLQMKGTCQLTVETGTKIITALFYVIDSNSHNLLTGACAIELDLIFYLVQYPTNVASLLNYMNCL